MAVLKPENVDTPQGLAFAISAYVLWGFLPLYLKALSHMSPVEIVSHRIIWSVPLAGALLLVLRRTKELRAALTDRRSLMMAALTAVLISVNWAIYVWAISTDQALDAALGYYINPLFSVFLGAVLLREKLNGTQIAAIGLAALAVIVLTVENGSLPLVSVSLTFTWGIYAFFKKSLPIGPNQGFLLEVLILTPPALGYLIYLTSTGQSHFALGLSDTMLLLGCGIVTAVPLILYANGAKLLRLSTIGILQYIAPTLIAAMAVFVFDEPIGRGRMIAFPLIWASLALYSWTLLRQARNRPAKQA